MNVLDMGVAAEKEGSVVWIANGRISVPSPPPSMNSWTQHMQHYYYHIFLKDLFVNSYFKMPFCCLFVLAVLVLLCCVCGGLNRTRLNYGDRKKRILRI